MNTTPTAPATEPTEADRQALHEAWVAISNGSFVDGSAIIARRVAAAIAEEKARADLYETEYRKVVQASLWMLDDPAIKKHLVLGKNVLVDGLPIIRSELSIARGDVQRLRREAKRISEDFIPGWATGQEALALQQMREAIGDLAGAEAAVANPEQK